MSRLGVNIDHVATLRKARGTPYPSIEVAAETVLAAGADQITIHLREDRRHIEDRDVPVVRKVTKAQGKLFNFEMGCAPEIVAIALRNDPDWICLVPEKREERTTEGGLDLLDQANFERVEWAMRELRAGLPRAKISLFLEANLAVLERAHALGADAVEVHTGDYAEAFLRGEMIDSYLTQYAAAKNYLHSVSMACHAGHGLTDLSVLPLVKEGLFEEYNIGHWIIAAAVFKGLGPVVSDLKKLMGS